MKHTIFMSLIAFFLLSTTAVAQGPDYEMTKGMVKNRQEKIFKKKLDFFKNNLILNKNESKKFEEAYKQYSKKRIEIKRAYKTDIVNKVKAGNLSELNENEKQKIIQRKLELDKRLYELNAGFNKQLIDMLPSEKVIRYFELERRFNRKLMSQLKKRRAMRKNRKALEKRRKDAYKRRKDMQNRRMQIRDQRRVIQSDK